MKLALILREFLLGVDVEIIGGADLALITGYQLAGINYEKIVYKAAAKSQDATELRHKALEGLF